MWIVSAIQRYIYCLTWFIVRFYYFSITVKRLDISVGRLKYISCSFQNLKILDFLCEYQNLFGFVLSTTILSALLYLQILATFTFSIGVNSRDWKESVIIVLGCMDMDLALIIEKLVWRLYCENIVFGDSEHMICKFNKSMYDLKQVFRHWYHKCH